MLCRAKSWLVRKSKVIASDSDYSLRYFSRHNLSETFSFASWSKLTKNSQHLGKRGLKSGNETQLLHHPFKRPLLPLLIFPGKGRRGDREGVNFYKSMHRENTGRSWQYTHRLERLYINYFMLAINCEKLPCERCSNCLLAICMADADSFVKQMNPWSQPVEENSLSLSASNIRFLRSCLSKIVAGWHDGLMITLWIRTMV